MTEPLGAKSDEAARPMRRDAVRNQRLVLDAADKVLAAEGADAFTTTRIAVVAGIPVGSVYHYFPDKAAIVEARLPGRRSSKTTKVSGPRENNAAPTAGLKGIRTATPARPPGGRVLVARRATGPDGAASRVTGQT